MSISFIQDDLERLSKLGLSRSLKEVATPQGREIVLNGKRVLNFCSNNYLGLADDIRISEAVKSALDTYGFGSGASYLVCGHMSSHRRLEEKIAQFKGTESALVYSSGYMANVGVISALVGRGDVVFSDKLNHASIVDGIILSRAEMKRYAHCDMNALEDALKSAQEFKRKLIVTDTVFSMDGDVAPLKEIVALAMRYDAMVMVDEAHGFGVLGKNGGGLVEELNLQNNIDIQMGTFSKAAGCFGAYVCASKAICDYLINHSRSFIYTTAIPPALAQAASVSIDIIQESRLQRQRLLKKADELRSDLNTMGINTLNSSTPIIPIILGDASEALEVSQRLLEEGIFVSAIRPPTVPQNTARLRVTLMATHTDEDLTFFRDRFRRALRK